MVKVGKHENQNIFTGSVIFEDDSGSFLETVQNANLRGAELGIEFESDKELIKKVARAALTTKGRRGNIRGVWRGSATDGSRNTVINRITFFVVFLLIAKGNPFDYCGTANSLWQRQRHYKAGDFLIPKNGLYMSVKLMSAIFETEFRDLKDSNGNTTKAATAKLVLLALADHANDEGESAYPSVERLSKKTALSPQTIRNTFDALKCNGIVMLIGSSKYMTNNYTINTQSFPRLSGNSDDFQPLQLLYPSNESPPPSNQSPNPLYPLDPNHHININKQRDSTPEKKGDILDGILAYSSPEEEQFKAAINAFEAAFGIDPERWEWYADAPSAKAKTWKDFRLYILKLWRENADCFSGYVTWSKQPFVRGAMTALGIRRNPELFPDSWTAYKASDFKLVPASEKRQSGRISA